MQDKPQIVAVGAHAADMEFTAGATLLKHVRNGWSAHLVHLSLGEKGHASLSPEAYAAQKKREAEEAAQILGATPHFLPTRDGEICCSDKIARDLARLFRRLRPKVVITHWRESLHADHVATHHLVHRALFLAGNRHFDFDGLPATWAPVYYAENWEDAEGYKPFITVDVTQEFDEWRRAFGCFEIGSGAAGKTTTGFPYWDWYEAKTRLNGIAIRAARAQTFAVEDERRISKRDLL